ncbi:MAG: GNAT family N-acetyltransferase [Spirochaetales bacterium]|nr:GNAT family N-acetyltransferase [Spirochaetales bacterium]
MEITIRSFRPEDVQELAHIDHLCTEGENSIFFYQRDDFLKRSRMYNKWAIFVAEAGNVVVGMVAACIKNLKITQKFAPTGYIYELKVHPRWRRKGIAYLLLKQIESYLRNEKVSYVYTYVLGANFIAKKICNAMDMYYCGEYSVLMFPCTATSAPDIQLVSGSELKKILPVIESDMAHYDLREKKPVSIQYKKPLPDSPFTGIFSLSKSLHTTAGVWNSSIYYSKVANKPSMIRGILKKMRGKIINKFKISQFTGTGEKLHIFQLFDIRQKASDPEILMDLIHGIQKTLIPQGVHFLMIHLDTRNPLYKILSPEAALSMNGRVLMRTSIPGELPPLLHCMYCDVRDF